jgi:hypothetical protein
MKMVKSEQSEVTVIEYIESMLGQLHVMAASQDLSTLAYLIEMARIEAHDRAAQAISSSSDDRNKRSGVAL